MALAEFRRELLAYRNGVDREGARLKDSFFALEHLRSLFNQFGAEEREMAEHVFAEWVLSEDEGLRFDGLVMVEEHKIASAIPHLRALAARLRSSRHREHPVSSRKCFVFSTS